jgi:hypothetical protein
MQYENAGSDAFSSLADNKGNSYGAGQLIGSAVTDASSGINSRMYVLPNATGGTGHTFTVTLSASRNGISIWMVEITGADTSSSDAGSGNFDTATPFTAPAFTNAQADEMLVSFIAHDSGSNPATLGITGWNIQQQLTNGTNTWPGGIATKLVSSIAAQTASWTATGASKAAVFITGVKAAAGGSNVSLTPAQAAATLTGRAPSMGFVIQMPDEP